MTDDGAKYIGKALCSVASAGICGVLLYLTHGEHGIGWFIFSLFVIW